MLSLQYGSLFKHYLVDVVQGEQTVYKFVCYNMFDMHNDGIYNAHVIIIIKLTLCTAKTDWKVCQQSRNTILFTHSKFECIYKLPM